MSDIIAATKEIEDISDITKVSIGKFISLLSKVNISDLTDVSIGKFVSSLSKITLSDDTNVKIKSSKSVNGYVPPPFLIFEGNKVALNLSSNYFIFQNVNVTLKIKAKSFDFIGIEKDNKDTSSYNYKKVKTYDTIFKLANIPEFYIKEFIRDFNQNFDIPIGVILADKRINFHFSNLSVDMKEIKEIRIPDYIGIELDTNYAGFTIPPYGSIRISGTAKFDKGADFVKDFLVVELTSGEKLRFKFIIIRQDDTIFYFAPDRGSHKEEYEVFTHDFTSLNGCQTVKLVVPTPKLTKLSSTLSLSNQRDFVKIQSVIDYQHKYLMSAALWVWSYEIAPLGIIKEIPLPFSGLKQIFEQSEKILIYEKNEFNKVQIGAVSTIDNVKISLKASVNLENNGNNYYVVPIRKGWAADSISFDIGMFKNGSIDLDFKES